MPREQRGDYEVGYGKPPRHTRFAKGQSGNPRGRPRGAKNFNTLLEEALDEPVTVTENGGRALRSANAKRLSRSSSIARLPPTFVRSRSSSTSSGTANVRPSRHRPRLRSSARRIRRCSSRSGRGSPKVNRDVRNPHQTRVRGPAAA
jgi:hypothetical protein